MTIKSVVIAYLLGAASVLMIGSLAETPAGVSPVAASAVQVAR